MEKNELLLLEGESCSDRQRVGWSIDGWRTNRPDAAEGFFNIVCCQFLLASEWITQLCRKNPPVGADISTPKDTLEFHIPIR